MLLISTEKLNYVAHLPTYSVLCNYVLELTIIGGELQMWKDSETELDFFRF